MPQRNKVLYVNEAEDAENCMKAIAKAIVAIQQAHGVTLIDIAEAINASIGTVSNAVNRKSLLNHVYIQRLGRVYGIEHLNPVAELMGARYAPLQANDTDPLPRILAAALKIGKARDPESDGGEIETHRELADMLPELRQAIESLQHMVLRAERARA